MGCHPSNKNKRNKREREREREYTARQRLQSLAETQCDLKSDMSKCGVFSPAASDAEMDFIPAGIEGSPHYARGEHVGRLRGMVFVGAPVGDDEWVMDELHFIFGKLVSRLPALARMRDACRLQVATQARTLLQRYCANPRAGFWLRMVPPHLVRRVAATFDDARDSARSALLTAVRNRQSGPGPVDRC